MQRFAASPVAFARYLQGVRPRVAGSRARSANNPRTETSPPEPSMSFPFQSSIALRTGIALALLCGAAAARAGLGGTVADLNGDAALLRARALAAPLEIGRASCRERV